MPRRRIAFLLALAASLMVAAQLVLPAPAKPAQPRPVVVCAIVRLLVVGRQVVSATPLRQVPCPGTARKGRDNAGAA